MHVNIYIETSFTGPAVKRAAGAWIVEYILKSGKTVTRGGILYADRTTENELVLWLIIKAVSILTKTCCVRVVTECRHVLNTMRNHWLAQWQKNNWVNAKNKKVKNAEAWGICAELFGKHMMEWADGCHEYRGCMQDRLRMELRKKHGGPDFGIYADVAVPEWNTEIYRAVGQDEEYYA